jgi:hypothetical protein
MSKLNPIPLLVAGLLIVSLACSLPSIVSTPDQNFINTVIAQTIVAGLTQLPPPVTPISGLESPAPTFTPEPPTLTPTATLSPTPVFTFTPLVPQISVSVPTNCRVGPGRVYDRVGGLLVGETAEVVGRNSAGTYWYIRNPDRPSEFCWLWGEYASLAGNVSVLPVFTPPPTPTPVPNFEASYSGLDTCVGWWVDIKLENTGGLTFRSISLTVRDTVTDIVLSVNTNTFTDLSGCLDSVTRDSLDPGRSRTVSSPPFAYNPVGHKLRATVTLCSNTGVSGTCVSKTIEFTP